MKIPPFNRLMKYLFIFLSFIATQVAATTTDIPQGISHWFHSNPPDPDSAKNGRRPSTLDVWIFRERDSICGLAQQDYGLESWNKTPYGDIVGYKVGNQFHIKFNDSFSEPTDLGEAVLMFLNGRLVIKESSSPATGYLSLSEYPLKKIGTKLPNRMASFASIWKKCAKSKEQQEKYLAEVL